jgi:cytochrome c-type biogenesis protein CcmH
MTGITTGRIVLGGAALVLGFAVTYAVTREPAGPATRTEAVATSEADPLANLEQQTKDQPQDVSAWRALGQGYFDAGRFDDAVRAYAKAAQLAPSVAAVWSALGEAQVMASKADPMPKEAAEAFTKALSLDQKDPRARYFSAVKRDLGGDHEGAIADWLALLGDTPAGAPWEADLRRTIEQVGKIHKIDVSARLAAVKQPSAPAGMAGPGLGPVMAGTGIAPALPVAAQGIPGPTAADLQAAGSIPPSQQREMAEGMVARLEGKLKANPGNIDGWVMLMRSRVTLAQPDKAAQALKDAIAANPAQAGRLKQEAGVLGVK